MTDPLEKQRALEAESVELGAERYRKERPMPWRNDADTAAEREEANLPPGRQLLRQVVVPVARHIEAAKEAAAQGQAGGRMKAMPMLHLMDPEEVAYITARAAINGARRRVSLANLGKAVADALRDHLNYDSIKRNEPAFFRSLMRANKKAGNYGDTWRRKIRRAMRAVDNLLVTWSAVDRINVGVKCLELLAAAVPDLYEIVREPNPKTGRQELVLRPTEKLVEWLERQHAQCELLNPLYLPMVAKPKPWTTPFNGGYLTGRRFLIKEGGRQFLDDLAGVDMPDVYAALSAIQEVPWRINRDVLEVMKQVWHAGSDIGGLPRREDIPLPPRPADMDDNPGALADWKRKASTVYQENAKAKAKRIGMSQLLWVSDKFSEEEAIYYPHNLDFRGRVYPIPAGGPSPQGDDAQKSLLQFAEGKPLGERGVFWLAVHIANLFGVDKVPFADRFEWVIQHHALLVDSGMHPLDGERFWTQADSPYCALAACVEWAGYQRHGKDHVSRIPIALDGSNSGLQHFSAMLRDPQGASHVNLVPNEKPADIYAEVARKVQALADVSEDPAGKAWAGGKVIRRIAKRPVMTYSYSATRFGMQEMIADELSRLDLELKQEGKPPHLEGFSNWDASTWLSHQMYAAIGATVSAACGAMEWLKAAATVAAKANLPIHWTSPIGLPVQQNYRKSTGQKVQVFVNGQKVLFNLEKPTLEIDGRGQASAVAPNFIHSCDASHLMRVALGCREAGINSLAVIHDSFGTHACDTDQLSAILRETMIEQYTPDVLARLRDELVEQLPPEVAEELPPLPKLGTLDLAGIRQAEYAFA